MPELPDITVYCDALRSRVIGQQLEHVRIVSPFLLRTFEPPIEAVEKLPVREVRRLGKQIVLCFDDELFLVFHLMIAGRFRWGKPGAKTPGKIGLASFGFPTGTLLLTEASQKRRVALYVVKGEAMLAERDAGGVDPLTATAGDFAVAIHRESHTLKRALTDPRLLSGIGAAYSDEILHAARLSPIELSQKLSDENCARLHRATQDVLTLWIERLRAQFADKFPGPSEVTAFRPEFAVHGKFGQPCPRCGHPVQQIRYAENETNYCAACQTGGRILADRSLSRLLKDDWPRTLEALED